MALTRTERLCGLVGGLDTLRDGDGHSARADLYSDRYERLASADRVWTDAPGSG